MIGLLIEAIGIYGVIRERGGQPVPMIQLPGGTTINGAVAAVALGFLMWTVGKFLLFTTAPRPRRHDAPARGEPAVVVSPPSDKNDTMDRTPDHGAPDERPEDHVG